MQALSKITDKVTEKARRLVDRYGVDVSMCVRVLLSALLPSGGHLAEGVGALCEYVAHKNLEINHEHVLELLGDLQHDQAHVNKALDALLNQLNPLLEQLMDTRQAEGLQLDQIHTLMQRQCLTSLSTQGEVAEVQRELLRMQPELTSIKRRSDEILSAQEATSAELRAVTVQMRTLMDVMLSHSAPLNPRELTTAQRREFYQVHARFHTEFLEQDLTAMEKTLDEMRALAPYHSMTTICEAALSSLQSDFNRAQEAMSGLPDELIAERDLEGVKEALHKLSPPPRSEEGYTFENEEGDACLGEQGWHQVEDSDEPTWALENLTQGWLLHTRAAPKRAQAWSVVSADGEAGALQVLKGQLTRRGDYFRRFKDEVSSLKSVEHPSVLRVLDWGRTPERDPYLVTESLRGETLEERLTRGKLSPNEMKQLGSSLFQSLEACHAQGVLHHNIHPCTIQFRGDNTPVLVGFGVSCQELELNEDGLRQDEFASPEQLRGEPTSEASDVYSLGTVLIDSVGGLNKVPKPWRETLTRFVNPVASSRPSAIEVNSAFTELTSKYYVTLPGRSARGPYEVERIVELICQGHDELTLQRVGSLYRVPWSEVEEVAMRTRAALQIQEEERERLEVERLKADEEKRRSQVDPFMNGD